MLTMRLPFFAAVVFVAITVVISDEAMPEDLIRPLAERTEWIRSDPSRFGVSLLACVVPGCHRPKDKEDGWPRAAVRIPGLTEAQYFTAKGECGKEFRKKDCLGAINCFVEHACKQWKEDGRSQEDVATRPRNFKRDRLMEKFNYKEAQEIAFVNATCPKQGRADSDFSFNIKTVLATRV